MQREIFSPAVGDVIDAAAVPAARSGFAGTVAQQHKRQAAVGDDTDGDGAMDIPGGIALALEGKGDLIAAQRRGLLRRRGIDDIEPVIPDDSQPGLPGHQQGTEVAAKGSGEALLLQFAQGAHHKWEQILPQQRENTVIPDYEMVTDLGYDGTDVEDLERVTEDGAVEITCSFTQEYLEEAWENQVAQVEKSYAFYEKSGADENAVKTAALSVQQHKQAHYEDMTATYVIDENQILRSIEYQITLIMPEITQDLSGNKMLGKDRKMQITVTAEVDRYNQGGIANKVQQYKTLVQEYME